MPPSSPPRPSSRPSLLSSPARAAFVGTSVTAALLASCVTRGFHEGDGTDGGAEAESRRTGSRASATTDACRTWSGPNVPPPSVLPSDPARRVACWRDVIVPRVVASAGGPWVAAGMCGDFTAKWISALSSKGYSLTHAQTEGLAEVVVNGVKRKLDKYHVYVSDRGLCARGQAGRTGECANEILVDPTWTQFLDRGECLDAPPGSTCAGLSSAVRSAPRVFVGRPSDAAGFYTRFRAHLRWDVTPGADGDTGRYDPVTLTRLLYSFGAASGLRTNL